ncbi:MAG TPA: hypothetical protein ENI23_11060 [bacterium]|nr:hypothetical protein [bacterium]
MKIYERPRDVDDVLFYQGPEVGEEVERIKPVLEGMGFWVSFEYSFLMDAIVGIIDAEEIEPEESEIHPLISHFNQLHLREEAFIFIAVKDTSMIISWVMSDSEKMDDNEVYGVEFYHKGRFYSTSHETMDDLVGGLETII